MDYGVVDIVPPFLNIGHEIDVSSGQHSAENVINEPNPPEDYCHYCPQDNISQLSYCSKCSLIICPSCWPAQSQHRPAYRDKESHLLHRAINLSIYHWMRSILDDDVEDFEQSRRHCEDSASVWFGLATEEGKQARFIRSDVYRDLISASECRDRSRQYPSFVSFVGPTGAGKSTLVKVLATLHTSEGFTDISRSQQKFPTPVPASRRNLGVPESGNVHLYADPLTLDSSSPILFADCEGLDGGNFDPRAIVARQGKFMLRKMLRMYQNFGVIDSESTNPNALTSGSEGPILTRSFCVEDLYPRILYAFSDVICFVSEQSNTTQVTLERLVKWAHNVLTTSVNQPALPRVVIIRNGMKGDVKTWLDEDEVTRQTLGNAQKMELLGRDIGKILEYWKERLPANKVPKSLSGLLQLYFDGVRVVYVPSKNNATIDVLHQQYKQLRNRIELECAAMQKKKRSEWKLQNVNELARYFNGALDHFSQATNLNVPFDFFAFSRANNPLPEGFDEHISNLMHKVHSNIAKGPHAVNRTSSLVALDSRVASLVASCISIDTLDTGAFRFTSQKVLEEYAQICEKAYDGFYKNSPCAYISDTGKPCVNHSDGHDKGHQDETGDILSDGDYQEPHTLITRQAFLDRISVCYTSTVEKLRKEDLSEEKFILQTVREHREVLRTEQKFWASTRSNKTCFFCLTHHPDHTLPCGHTVCETCIQRFGNTDRFDALESYFDQCYLCLKPTIRRGEPWTIRLKPQGSGIRILSLDGGGVRGVISVKMLQLLEAEIGLGVPLHEFFDVIIGTSTGGIIALGLGSNLWSGAECLSRFKEFAKGAFKRHFSGNIPLWTYAVTYWQDSEYRDSAIEAQLKEAFSKSAPRKLFGYTDCASNERRSVKIGVTATKCLDAEAVVMANYNRKDIDGAKILREDDPELELEIWQAARSTSAAPMIFVPYSTGGVQYQDGGLKHNNPARLAMNEANAIWQEAYQLDVLVSMGTGYSDEEPPAPSFWKSLIPSFAKRTWTWFNKELDTEIQWRDFYNGLNNDKKLQARLRRLNVHLPLNRLPGLDDTRAIDPLEDATRIFFEVSENKMLITKTAEALIASCFYLKVVKVARANAESYRITGQILCRLAPKYQRYLISKLSTEQCIFYIQKRKWKLESELETRSGTFCMPINYDVPKLSERTNVYLAFRTQGGHPEHLPTSQGRYNISGSPWCLDASNYRIVDEFYPSP